MTPKERRERWEAMKRLREEGMTYREIGERFGVSAQRASKVIACGPVAGKRGRKRLEDRLSDAEIAAAVEEYRAGSGLEDVARLLGASAPAVARLLTDRGVEIRKRGWNGRGTGRRWRGHAERDARDAEIVRARMGGASFAEIGHRFGISIGYASGIVRRMAPELEAERRRLKEERDAKIERLARAGESVDSIAEQVGLCRESVRDVIRVRAPDLTPRWIDRVRKVRGGAS